MTKYIIKRILIAIPVLLGGYIGYWFLPWKLQAQ